MTVTLPFDLHYHIIDLVLSSSIGWSRRDSLKLKGLQTPRSSKDIEARAFLATCCLVSKYWLIHAQKRLYTFMRLTLATRPWLEAFPCLGKHTKYLNVDARVIGAFSARTTAAELFLSVHTHCPSLKSLIVWDNSFIGVMLPKIPEWHTPSSSLTHVLSMGSSAVQLAYLLALLPNLTSLHVGRLPFVRHITRETFDIPLATCRLREIVFQTVYHFDGDFLDCILGSSSQSLTNVTLAGCGATFYDIIDYITGATCLTLSVKEGDYSAQIQESDTLDRLLTKFTDLKSVQVYVRKSWKGDWPDHEHASLARKFPESRFTFLKAVDDFLRAASAQDLDETLD